MHLGAMARLYELSIYSFSDRSRLLSTSNKCHASLPLENYTTVWCSFNWSDSNIVGDELEQRCIIENI